MLFWSAELIENKQKERHFYSVVLVEFFEKATAQIIRNSASFKCIVWVNININMLKGSKFTTET